MIFYDDAIREPRVSEYIGNTRLIVRYFGLKMENIDINVRFCRIGSPLTLAETAADYFEAN